MLFCGPDNLSYAYTFDGVHLSATRYKVCYGYNTYVDSLDTLETYVKQILLQK